VRSSACTPADRGHLAEEPARPDLVEDRLAPAGGPQQHPQPAAIDEEDVGARIVEVQHHLVGFGLDPARGAGGAGEGGRIGAGEEGKPR
jgi:hypothetical protein